MTDPTFPPPPLSGQGPGAPDMSGQWLSVADAVVLCAEMGLSRDIKTIRRWAQRSHARPENAEVLVHEQDTPTGFRYVIEKTSLERKIAQELAFEANRAEADIAGQAPPRPDGSAPVPVEDPGQIGAGTEAGTPPPVPPGPDMSVRKLDVVSIGDDFLKEQISQKDGQITELNAQIERRDRQIDAMLERDKETNILINTLQETLSQAMGLESPARMQLRVHRAGDSQPSEDHRDAV